MARSHAPITSIAIRSFRGIARGRLERLTGLTVLTGKNGCGKSAVLDAALLASSDATVDALQRIVQRHPTSFSGARWLRYSSEGSEEAVRVQTSPRAAVELHVEPQAGQVYVSAGSAQDAFMGGKVTTKPIAKVWFNADNTVSEANVSRPLSRGRSVVLLDPGLPVRLEDSFSEAYRRGGTNWIQPVLESAIPGFEELRVLKDEDSWVLYIKLRGENPVPVALAGDGVQAVIQIALRLSAAPAELFLIEEPETYLHPRVLSSVARLLWSVVERGSQVVTTTHSLELIDALIALAPDELRSDLSLQLLRLEAGELTATRFSNEEMEDARGAVEVDLR